MNAAPALAGIALLLAASVADARQWSNWSHRYRATVPAIDCLLPFDNAARVRVDQGPNGRYSHDDDANRYAIDFALPEGTPVLAAREGVVMQVESGIRDNLPQRRRDGVGEAGNFVRVRHDDGSLALYAHLQADGVSVRAGQRVRAGERIGLSGNTGFSTAPHLHFVVQVQRGARLESVPVRVMGPLGELRFPRDSR